ncbi:zinc finger transcription factor 1 [Lichtheimia corymbifera JMRC:FSU:9682]|uniref:Zinc finger transcription factor 1 n=1 Tax=Lichtheimia corymbifera JMRC:FSU:9682 TaxID=1263082 RepID=A0A068S1I2_9FUNG|nr:zinc finger transcription factor 1 [Lichtheimia corymbifera JMRC:FSU:9682]
MDNDHSTDDGSEPKRKRLAQACDSCRRKKVKCDGTRPVCGTCNKMGRTCTYNPVVQKRGPRQGYIEIIEKRLDKMERLLSQHHQQQQHSTDHHHHHPQSPMSDKSSLQHTNHDRSTSSGSFPSPSLGTTPNAAAIMPLSSPSSNIQPPQSILQESILPPSDVVDHLVKVFFNCITNYVGIFNEESLLRDIRERRCSDFLILSILAVAARYSDRSDICEDPPWHSGEKYACKARSILFSSIDIPSLSNVQALILLTMHEYSCARGPRSWMYSGMAVRMALELGLNKDIDLKEDGKRTMSVDRWIEIEVQRRVFWAVFTLDKLLSASTGRPSILQEDDCETLLPCDKYEQCTGEIYTESIYKERSVLFTVRRLPENSNMLEVVTTLNPASSDNTKKRRLSCIAYMHRMSSLLGKVTAHVNRKSRQGTLLSLNGPPPETMELDQEIEKWDKELPPELQDTQENDKRFKEGQLSDGPRYILLHMSHHSLIVLLHRPSLAVMDSLKDHPVASHVKDIITRNASKCLAAVDRVTDLLRRIKNDRAMISPFVSYLTYTVATITVNTVFNGTPEESSKARAALADHFAVLQIMRTHWAMADKLYFMIRDLYAMHSSHSMLQRNASTSSGRDQWQQQRQQQQAPSQQLMNNGSCGSMMMGATSPNSSWPAVSHTRTTAGPDLEIQQHAIGYPATSSSSSSSAPIQVSTSMEGNTAPAAATTASSSSIRGMSLADLSLSSCDGASCTDWIVGDNSKYLAAALQSLGRTSSTDDSLIDIASMPPPPFVPAADTQWPFDFGNNASTMPPNSRPS